MLLLENRETMQTSHSCQRQSVDGMLMLSSGHQTQRHVLADLEGSQLNLGCVHESLVGYTHSCGLMLPASIILIRRTQPKHAEDDSTSLEKSDSCAANIVH